MVAAFLDRNAESLRVFHAGTERSRYYSPLVAVDDNSLVSTVGQSGMTDSRELVQCLTARAMLQLHEGRVDGAWRDILACHRWARLAGHGPYLIDDLLAKSWSRYACVATVAIAQHGNITAMQAREIASAMSKLPPAGRTRDVLEFGERLSVWVLCWILPLAAPSGSTTRFLLSPA